MYIKYSGVLYDFLDEKEHYELITRKEEKTDDTYNKDWEVWFKEIPIDDPKIEEIFDVHYLVDYDTKLKCVPTTWRVDEEEITFSGDKILLVFGHGTLPGWKVVENTVCEKFVKLEEVENIRIVYKYKVKNGEKYDTPLREEKELTKDEFKKMADLYRSRNI